MEKQGELARVQETAFQEIAAIYSKVFGTVHTWTLDALKCARACKRWAMEGGGIKWKDRSKRV